jgi:hypothetical protein
VVYSQLAYKFHEGMLGSLGTGGLFASMQRAVYGRLSAPVDVYAIGTNWFMQGNNSKMSLQYENRPTLGNPTDLAQTGRASSVTFQYQIFF